MGLSIYLTAWLFRKSNLGFGEEGWRWVVTGAKMFLVHETSWMVNWAMIGLEGSNNPLNWFHLGLDLFGWLIIAFGAVKLILSMLSEDEPSTIVPTRP